MSRSRRLADLVLVLRIAARLLRRRRSWSSLAPLAFSSFTLTGIFVLFGALTLSSSQVAERDLGRFEHFAGFGTTSVRPGDGTVAEDLDAALRRAQAGDPMVSLVTLDGGTMPGMSGRSQLHLREASWQDRPFPERYALTRGRWARSPGEAVLVNAPASAPKLGQRLALLSGRVQLRLVGFADDKYYNATEALTSPGTWASLRSDIADDFPAFRATSVVFWSKGDPTLVLPALREGLAKHTSDSREQLDRALQASLTSKTSIVRDLPRYSLGELPLVYAVPSLLLPALATAVLLTLEAPWRRRTSRLLTGVGLRGSIVGLPLVVYTLLRAFGAVALGFVLGYPVGTAAAHIVGVAFDEPLGDIMFPWSPLVRSMLAAGLVVAAAFWAQAASRGQNATTSSLRHKRRGAVVTSGRHLTSVAALCLAMVLVSRLSDITDAMFVTGALSASLLLFSPEIVAWVLDKMPERDRRMTLALRQMRSNQPRVVFATVLLACVSGTAFGFVTLLDSMIRTSEAALAPSVQAGQLLVQDTSSLTNAPAGPIVRAVQEGSAPTQPPVELRRAFDSSGTFVTVAGGYKPLLVLDSSADAARLIGQPLTDPQQRTLENGGVVVWEGGVFPPGRAPDRTTMAGLKAPMQRADIPVSTAVVEPYRWRQGVDGVVLASTAKRWRVPVANGALLFTGLDRASVRRALRTVADRGLDTAAVDVYVEPEPPIPPTTLRISTLLTSLLMAGILVLLTRTQTHALRNHVANLIRIGLPPGWGRGVLVRQLVIMFGLGLTMGALMAGIPVLAFRLLVPSLILDVPWAEIVTLLIGVAGTIALVTWTGVRRLELTRGLEW